MLTRLLIALLVALSAHAGLAAGRVSRAQESAVVPETGGLPTILFVSQDDPDQAYVRDVLQGFRRSLDGARTQVMLYREYFDQLRFGDRPAYADEFREWLHQKYRDRHIDVIVVTEQRTLQLFARDPRNPWNDVPVVYGTFGDLTIDISRTHPTASGVVTENYVPALLDLIKTILPETRRIAAIQGARAEERSRDAWWIAQIRERGLDVMDLGGLTIDQLLTRVAALPGDTVPLILSFQTDAAGRTFRPGQVTDMVAQAANRPLFRLVEQDAAQRLLGGTVPDWVLAGQYLGAHALARMEGKPPSIDRIPASTYVRPVFDSRELSRWGIPESRLPAGSIVRFRPPSLWRDYRPAVITAAAIVLFQSALIVVVFAERRKLQRAQTALGRSYAKLQDLTSRLITAQEEERTRIARDLHDDIGQRLVSLSIALSNAKRRVTAADQPSQQELATLQQQAASVSTDLRHLSHDLHPGVLQHLGLVEALRSRCDEFHTETSVETHLEVCDAWRDVPDHIALCLYRVAQEALRNVAQHANAHRVTVALSQQDGRVSLRIKDDGRGFDPHVTSRRTGLGLLSLGERVRMLGGTMEVGGLPAAGTALTVTLPIGGTDATDGAPG